MREMEEMNWINSVEECVEHYLHLKDGGFDENMKAYYVGCNYQECSVTIGFETQGWQINERQAIHGGAIAGMFDTAMGTMANFIAGKNEATTADMNLCFIRELELGQHCQIRVITVKAGRRLIRLRAEMICEETQKLIATGSGSWVPL